MSKQRRPCELECHDGCNARSHPGKNETPSVNQRRRGQTDWPADLAAQPGGSLAAVVRLGAARLHADDVVLDLGQEILDPPSFRIFSRMQQFGLHRSLSVAVTSRGFIFPQRR